MLLQCHISIEGETPKSVKRCSEFMLPLKSAIQKEGYVFKGWRINGIFYQPGSILTVEKDLAVTIEWIKIEEPYCEVVFENGNTIRCRKGDNIRLPPASNTKKGYTFKGWVWQKTLYAPDSYIAISEDMRFTQKWELIKCEVKLLGYKTLSVKYGSTVTLPKVTENRLCRIFIGWRSGNKFYRIEDKVTIHENCIFEQVWDWYLPIDLINTSSICVSLGAAIIAAAIVGLSMPCDSWGDIGLNILLVSIFFIIPACFALYEAWEVELALITAIGGIIFHLALIYTNTVLFSTIASALSIVSCIGVIVYTVHEEWF